jgi:cytochrome P450
VQLYITPILGHRAETQPELPIPGDEANTLIGAANRDPAQFPNADRLVLDRPDNRHLSFGHGAHLLRGWQSLPVTLT